jgi:hypothetical protein
MQTFLLLLVEDLFAVLFVHVWFVTEQELCCHYLVESHLLNHY